jgi:hypothetical protein
MDGSFRRELVFEDLQSVMRDVESLRDSGCARAGEWNLAQTCGHLASWMAFPVSGYPRPPLIARVILRLSRGRAQKQLEQVLGKGLLPLGQRTARSTIPPADADEADAVASLRLAVDRFIDHDGNFHPSPFFGELDRAAHLKLQLVHCAHHLSFLRPSA